MWEDFALLIYNTHNNCKMMWYIDYNLTCNEGNVCVLMTNDLKADLNSYVLIPHLYPLCNLYSMMGCAPLAQTGNGTRLKSIKPWLWDVVDNYTLQTNMFVQR